MYPKYYLQAMRQSRSLDIISFIGSHNDRILYFRMILVSMFSSMVVKYLIQMFRSFVWKWYVQMKQVGHYYKQQLRKC